ncbi:MAG: DUF308 domain-containing protein [Bacteroidaceae bacterium]|nr:DUF308 domain-containing protein [Bacteroidaceae bacterium]
MKKINSSFLRILMAVVLGLVLVIWPGDAVGYLVITIGILFLIPGLLSLISYMTPRLSLFSRRRFPFGGIACTLLGICLIVKPDFFANATIFVLGFFLAMAGVQQISSLIKARGWMKVPFGFFIAPLLLLIVSIFCLFKTEQIRDMIFIAFGVMCLVYAAYELLIWASFMRLRPVDKVEDESLKADAEDAVIIENETKTEEQSSSVEPDEAKEDSGKTDESHENDVEKP